MYIKEIKELKQAIEALSKFCNGGAIRTKQGDINKCSTGFNKTESGNMAGKHGIYYSALYGYFGDSSVYPQIKLPQSTHELFWECFDDYLNEHEDQILNAVCQKMQIKLSKEITTVQKEINDLTQIVKDLEVTKTCELEGINNE